MNDKQSPIFSKTYDFILWLLNHTENFPKSERFRMAKRLEDSTFEFHTLLVRAARSRRTRDLLFSADLELDRLRLFMRLALARKLTTKDQYHHAAGLLVEIGKLLGGWQKSLNSENRG